MGCEHFGNPDDPESPCFGCWVKDTGLRNPISATRHKGKANIPKLRKIVEDVEQEEQEETTEELLEEIAKPIAERDLPGVHNKFGIPEYHLPDDVTISDEGLIAGGKPVCQIFYVKPLQFNQTKLAGNILVSADRKEWFSIPAKKLSHPGQLSGELMSLGIMVWDDKRTMNYCRQASLLEERRVEVSQFGWGHEYKSAYIVDGPVGIVDAEASEDLLKLQKKWQSTQGSLDNWLEATQIYSREGQEPYLMAVLASLASPMLNYYNLEKGIIYSLTGPGGTGKTTALKVASSIWGKPLHTLSSMSSTFIATRIYLSLCGNLPMILDDITQMDPVDLKQFALEISQGIGRERGNKTAGLAHSETWQLNCLTTSNVSVHTKLADLVDTGSADMNRVVEVPVIQSEHVSPQQGNELLDAVMDNHGHLGRLFIEHMLTKDREQELKTFKRFSSSLWDKDNLTGSDRFSHSLISSCYWVHKRIKEVLPDFPGDPEQQLTWMRKQLQRNNRFILDVLTTRIPTPDDFIMEFMSESLVIKKIGESFPPSGQSMKGYVYDDGMFFVIPKATLETWCKKHGLKSRTVLNRWGESARLVNMGPDHISPRWTGRLVEGLKIDGKIKKPTVIKLHKGETFDDSEDE